MQQELDPSEVRLLGVNGVGLDSGNVHAIEVADLPWLQATDADDPWSTWRVVYRDVIVLDAENKPLFRYNLTDNDLGDAANHDELLELLRAEVE